MKNKIKEAMIGPVVNPSVPENVKANSFIVFLYRTIFRELHSAINML